MIEDITKDARGRMAKSVEALAHDLTNRYDILFFETLNLRGMQRLWGRKLSDLAFGEFLKILEHIANKKGKQVVYIDRFFPSSKKCCHCRYLNRDLQLSDRYWRCPNCHRLVDRDDNAAVNIYREGASSLRRAGIRPPLVRQPVLTPLETHHL